MAQSQLRWKLSACVTTINRYRNDIEPEKRQNTSVMNDSLEAPNMSRSREATLWPMGPAYILSLSAYLYLVYLSITIPPYHVAKTLRTTFSILSDCLLRNISRPSSFLLPVALSVVGSRISWIHTKCVLSPDAVTVHHAPKSAAFTLSVLSKTGEACGLVDGRSRPRSHRIAACTCRTTVLQSHEIRASYPADTKR